MKSFLQKHYPLILLSLGALILIIRAFYGFCWSDETFYYSIAYRFLQGDAPFVEEWYPTQLNSIFLMPFVALFRLITGGNDGMILTFRILYVLVSWGIAWFLYSVMRRETAGFGALLGALLFLFYTHLNIITFSYYAVSTLAGTLSMLFVVRYMQLEKTPRKADRSAFFAGLVFAVFILSMPSMVIYYVAAVIVLAVLSCLAKCSKRSGEAMLAIRAFRPLHFFFVHLLGILTVAIPFSIYFFTHVPLDRLMEAMPYVLSDEEHAAKKTLYVTFRTCFRNLTQAYGIWLYLAYLAIALAVLLFLFQQIRQIGNLRQNHPRLFFYAKCAILILDLVAFAGMFVKGAGHTGYVTVALVIFTVVPFILQKKPPLHLFFTFVILGGCMAYSYTHTSSGSPLYTESIGFAVASFITPAVILSFVRDLAAEYPGTKKQPVRAALYSAGCLVLLLSLLMTMVLRMTNIYRDDTLSNLTVRISDGPAAGIMTSPAHLSSYESVLATIREECTSTAYPDGKHELLLITKLLPWGYLCSDLRCASAYSWRSPIASKHLQSYYRVHPDKYPDVVLILNEDVGSYEACGDVVADPIPNQNELSGDLYQYLLDEHFIKKSVPCGTLFVRP